jgi:hypothetical protein
MALRGKDDFFGDASLWASGFSDTITGGVHIEE